MNDTLFRDGGITDNNPRLLAIIADSAGINTTGSGIGHDLTVYLDDDRNNSIVLNNYFENDFNDYMRGKVTYDFYNLIKGNHSLTLKAWDNYNNSSEKTLYFIVDPGDKFILTNLINYPNPVISETRITGEHNRPDDELEISISIFNISGRLIRIIKTKQLSSGYRIVPVVWDCTDEGGRKVSRGVYPYRITVRTAGGEIALRSGSMIIL